MTYDWLNRVLEDSQTCANQAANVTNISIRSHPITEFAFPSGGHLQNQYDAIYGRVRRAAKRF